MIRASVVLLSAMCLAGCVDTELGLEAVIDSARVTVGADDSVSARIEITYRVGEFATGDRTFQPQSIEVFTGDSIVSMTSSLDAPPGFVTNVSPGESFSSPLVGVDMVPVEPRRLCGAEARVLFRWLDSTMTEIGMTEAVTSDVTCE